MEAIADRIIPPDPQTPGGKDAGCAVFVDRQLAGPYGRQDGLYVQPPFHAGTPNQGPQSLRSIGRQTRMLELQTKSPPLYRPSVRQNRALVEHCPSIVQRA